MRKALPFLIISFLLSCCSLNNLFAQADYHGVLFVFDSGEKLISLLESPDAKTVSFTAEGIRSAQQAKTIESSFQYAGERVKSFSLKKDRKGIYQGSISLIADVRTSHFSKILITCGIREIKVDGKTIHSYELNDLRNAY